MDVSFERTDQKDEWLTPPEIIKALGTFDLDPCAPIIRPWDTAKQHYTMLDNGLLKEWTGRVWCNPPYGQETKKWFQRCAAYGNAICLTFARTETKMFFESVWPLADAVFFLQGRLRFYNVKGDRGGTAGAPSILIAYGRENVEALRNSGLKGKLIELESNPPC